MIDQPSPAVISRNPSQQVMTMAVDALTLAGLIALRGATPKAPFWIALMAGIGLFALRLSSDGWGTGHLVYLLPPR